MALKVSALSSGIPASAVLLSLKISETVLLKHGLLRALTFLTSSVKHVLQAAQETAARVHASQLGTDHIKTGGGGLEDLREADNFFARLAETIAEGKKPLPVGARFFFCQYQGQIIFLKSLPGHTPLS